MRLLLSILLIPILLHAQEAGIERAPIEPSSLPAPDQPVETPTNKPAVKQLDNGMMQIGEITFDPKSRQIRVPCTINMTEGLLEFALVHENGKIHESLLITTASALHMNIAFKLLRYTPSEELYFIEKEKGVTSGKYPDVPEDRRKAARIDVLIEFEKDGKTRTYPIRDLIVNNVTEKAMGTEDWIYGGSLIYDGKFIAETNGDFASIFVSRGSLILFAGKERENDEVWSPYTSRLPEMGTKATFIVQPIANPNKKQP